MAKLCSKATQSLNTSPCGAPGGGDGVQPLGYSLSLRPQPAKTRAASAESAPSPARRYRRGVLHQASDLLHHVVAAVLAQGADELGQAGLGPADGPVLQGGVGALVVGGVAVGEGRHLALAGVAQELVDVLPLAPHLGRHQLQDVDACGAEEVQVRHGGRQPSGAAGRSFSKASPPSPNSRALLFFGWSLCGDNIIIIIITIIIIIIMKTFHESRLQGAPQTTSTHNVLNTCHANKG